MEEYDLIHPICDNTNQDQILNDDDNNNKPHKTITT